MATDTKLDNLVINYLTQSQYDNAKSSGTLNANQIYMTPASSSTYTLPAATSSTLGGVKIGSNITVSSGTISLTKANVTSALGYTPPTTDTKYTLPTGNASTAGGVKLSDSTSSISSTSGGIAATPAAVFAAIAEAKLAAWPIGSIYMSVNSTSPANLFGGTWEMISDTFLFAASSSLDKQRITIGRISSGDRATIRALCEGLGLISAGLYRETCADGNQWMLDVGPVSSGDAWYIMRKCAELQLIDAGLYKAEYVEE